LVQQPGVGVRVHLRLVPHVLQPAVHEGTAAAGLSGRAAAEEQGPQLHRALIGSVKLWWRRAGALRHSLRNRIMSPHSDEQRADEQRSPFNLSLAPDTPSAADPVCGMTVDPAHAPASRTHQGKTYYFCNPGCAHKFEADPERYLSGTVEPVDHAAVPPGSKVEYVCPMDPE